MIHKTTLSGNRYLYPDRDYVTECRDATPMHLVWAIPLAIVGGALLGAVLVRRLVSKASVPRAAERVGTQIGDAITELVDPLTHHTALAFRMRSETSLALDTMDK